jgi:UDP-glucose:(heptosyl)LPS alpha-1,3-glucosyltransferase
VTDRHLRIAYVVHDYHRHGGHSRYVAELAERFCRFHDIHVFANTFTSAADGITRHNVPAMRLNALTTIASFILPATVLVRGRFDIIHAQGLCGLRQNVITAHICQPAWAAAADRYAGRQSWRKRAFGTVVGRLERLAFRPTSASRFIAVSNLVRGDLHNHYGLTDRVRVVHHGTDTEAFHPRNRAKWRAVVRAELGLSETECIALYVGDLQKAGEPAVRAVARVPGVTLVIVSRSEFGPYERLAAEVSAANRVRFVPATTSVERYYAAADMFLFPTFYDAFGLVVAEAMASGLPVITSPAAGASELIEHGVSGWLTPDPWNVDQIAIALRDLADDAGLRERLGRAARMVIEEQTWDRVAAETMAVYREVVGQ